MDTPEAPKCKVIPFKQKPVSTIGVFSGIDGITSLSCGTGISLISQYVRVEVESGTVIDAVFDNDRIDFQAMLETVAKEYADRNPMISTAIEIILKELKGDSDV